MCSSGEGPEGLRPLPSLGVCASCWRGTRQGTVSPRAGSSCSQVHRQGDVSCVTAGVAVCGCRGYGGVEAGGGMTGGGGLGGQPSGLLSGQGCLGGGCLCAPRGALEPSVSPLSFLVQILRHFEASCRQRTPARRPPAEPGPAALHMGPSDLLTDTMPFAGGQAFLQPMNPTLFSLQGSALPPPLDGSSLSVSGDAGEVETRLVGSREHGAPTEWSPLGTGSPKGEPERSPGPSSCLQSLAASSSHSSLFAGMELVACPRLVGAGTATEEAPQPPWTLSRKVAAREPPGPEPSAFPFLNS